jgi:hypothetical protein
VRSWRQGTVGVPWRAHAGRDRAEGREKGEGVRAFSPLSSGSLGRGPSRGGGCGVNRGEVYGYGDGARAYGNGVSYSSLGFTDFCPHGVRRNARMNSNFEFLKNSNWGGQDNKPGFQEYFF